MMTIHGSLSHIHNDSHEEEHHPNFLGTEEKKYLHAQETAQKISFCIPRCSACKNEMQFIEGEVIYGKRWYHSSCWKNIEEVIKLVSQ